MQQDFFYISRRGAVAILWELFNRGWINQNGVRNIWEDMKQGIGDVTLPTGAKMFRDKLGNIGVYSYAYDMSDIKPYRKYALKEVQ